MMWIFSAISVPTDLDTTNFEVIFRGLLERISSVVAFLGALFEKMPVWVQSVFILGVLVSLIVGLLRLLLRG